MATYECIFPYSISEIELTPKGEIKSEPHITIDAQLDESTYRVKLGGRLYTFVHDNKYCALGTWQNAAMQYHYNHLGLCKIPKNNSLFAEVSKNACTTIITEIYNHFFKSEYEENITADKGLIWQYKPFHIKRYRYMTLPLNIFLEQMQTPDKFKYNTIFLIYDDPLKRFVRALNDKYIQHHEILSYLTPPYDKNIEDYIDKAILLTRLDLLNSNKWDQHIVPITTYHKNILPYVTDIVFLKDLDRFMKERFNINPTQHNVSKEKIITIKNLNNKQIETLKKIYQDDYTIPEVYSDKIYK